jgi:CubicO group peptidase (beta-lactamase class C family)
MFAPSKKTKLLSAVLFLSAASALAAPPADPKFVDLWSRMDEFHAARGIKKSSVPRELKRAQVSTPLDSLIDEFLAAHPNTGLLVLKGDTILAERYQYGRTDGHRFASASVAKTVLAMLVGIAVHDKKLSLEDTADQYIPALKGHPYGETTIRHLLTMSSGIGFNNDENALIRNTLLRQTEGGADTVLDLKQRVLPAGTRFRYASGDSQVLGLVLIAATKKPLADYLSEKIWQPMGAEAHATWLLDKGGYETGYCCINATVRDYARFGMLLANYGALDGKQLIPAEWVKAATTPEAPHLAVGTATQFNGYGYQTWITHRTEPRFAALGLHGQAIYVDPVRKLVVVHTAAWVDPNDRAARGAQFRLFESIVKTL